MHHLSLIYIYPSLCSSNANLSFHHSSMHCLSIYLYISLCSSTYCIHRSISISTLKYGTSIYLPLIAQVPYINLSPSQLKYCVPIYLPLIAQVPYIYLSPSQCSSNVHLSISLSVLKYHTWCIQNQSEKCE
jgi:hypothetical protein